jgi:hypothetical protein
MKRTSLAITVLALLLAIAPLVSAQEVSVDLFYNNLNGGQWIDAEGYGYGWQPDVAVNDPNWRPYMDGYWAYTDVGYTWVSYEDFGWATYHYGRWAKMADYGWVWFPGTDLEWGPAWVSWRHGAGVVGWAPLPPRGPGIVYEGQPIGVDVDVVFDIGPAYYNFIDVRYIGEPVLRERIFAPAQNVTYINQTVNVTNITVNNNVVYNYGPDYNVLSAQSSRPIQRLTLERQQNVDPTAAVKSGAITKVQGDRLVVAAPPRIRKPAAAVPPPPTVKAKVAQPKVEKGWTGVANAAEIRQKIKTEDHKKIPPAPPGGAAAAGAAGRAAPGAAASPMVSPARAATSPAGAAASPAGASVAPGATATAASAFEKGKVRGRRGQPPQPAQPAATAAPAFSPAAGAPPTGSPAGKHRGPGERPGEHLGATPPMGGPVSTPPGAPNPRGKARGVERGMPTQPPGQPAGGPNQTPLGRHHGPPATSPTPLSGGPSNQPKRPERLTGQSAGQGANAPERENGPRRGQPAMSPSEYSGAGAERRTGGPGRGQPPPQEGAAHRPPAGAAASPSPGEHGRGKAEGGKKKPGESPTPAPY